MGRGCCMSCFDVGDADELVVRFGVGERGVEFLLPVGVGGKGDARPWPRAACSWSMSLARSMTAVATRSFFLAHVAPPSLESCGATCSPRRTSAPGRSARSAHRSARRRRTRGSGALPSGRLFQQLHAAIAADAVRQMDDQIPFAQLQKTVDGPRFVGAPAGLATEFRPAKQLLIAEDDQDPFRDQTEAVRHVAHAQLDAAAERAARLRQQLGQAGPFALVVAGDQHLFVAADDRFQLASASVRGPLNRSIDSTRRWHVVS